VWHFVSCKLLTIINSACGDADEGVIGIVFVIVTIKTILERKQNVACHLSLIMH
jgi:hypothetical protein